MFNCKELLPPYFVNVKLKLLYCGAFKLLPITCFTVRREQRPCEQFNKGA